MVTWHSISIWHCTQLQYNRHSKPESLVTPGPNTWRGPGPNIFGSASFSTMFLVIMWVFLYPEGPDAGDVGDWANLLYLFTFSLQSLFTFSTLPKPEELPSEIKAN